MLAGVRAGRPDWIEAGARAQAYAAEHATRPAVGVREHADGLGLQPAAHARARRRPRSPPGAPLWEQYLREIKPVYNARVDAPQLHSNKYIVEAVAYFELARSGLRSDVPGAVADRAAARRAGAACDILNRIVPARVRALRGHAWPGTASPRSRTATAQPLAYHALTAGLLARAIDVAGPAASRAARRALRIGVRTMWAYQAPDGDLAYFGRSQGQSWALALGALAAAARPRPGRATRQARAFRAVADRALGRLAALPSDRRGRDGDRALRRRPGDDPRDRRLRERGRLQRPDADRARLGRRTRAAARAAAPAASSATATTAARVLPFEDARFATLRAGRVWMAVKQSSQPPRRPRRVRAPRAQVPRAGRALDRPRARRAAGRRRARRARSGRRCGCARARWRARAARAIERPPRPDRRARRLDRAAGRWVRRGTSTFRFVADRARRAHRRPDAPGRPDRLLGADRRPAASATRRGVAVAGGGHARVRRGARRAARPVRRRAARSTSGARTSRSAPARQQRPLRGPRARRPRRAGASSTGAREPSVAPALASDDHRDRDHAGHREVLAEDEEAEQRRDRRLEAHDHAEQRRRQPAQRDQLERVGQQRDQQREPDAGEQHLGREQLGARARRRPTGSATSAATHERDREPLEPRPARADPLGQQDVAPPSTRPRRTRSATPAGVERLARPVAERQQRDARAREQRPSATSRAWREPASATPSGPRNSIVTATPSGIRAIASKNASVSRPEQAPSATAARRSARGRPRSRGPGERPQDQRGERQPQRDRPGRRRCGRTAAPTARRRAGSSSSTPPPARCPARGPRRGAGGSGAVHPRKGDGWSACRAGQRRRDDAAIMADR